MLPSRAIAFPLIISLCFSLFQLALATGDGTIVKPANGTIIQPGAAFDFEYITRGDYGVSSYNYTVFLLTKAPTSLFDNTGYYFGRFSQENYPGNPYPVNPPAQFVMPDFSRSPGGFGTGASGSNVKMYFVVVEEYATFEPSLGVRLGVKANTIQYNVTT